MAPKKNILLLIADDLGRDLSIYGYNNAPRTPNIEKLAAQGTVFENAFASTASCSGSRSTLYTGLHTHQNGQYGLARGHSMMHYFNTFDMIETHPKIYNPLGYLTGIGAKVHVGPPRAYPFTVRDENHVRNGTWIAERLEAFIDRAHHEDKPWFYTVGFIDPHRDGTRDGFGNKPAGYPGIEKHVHDPGNVNIPHFLPDLPEVRHELAEYYQAIDRMDQGVGMFMKVLERKGELDSTLVVFLSDNGPPFVNSKTTLYDAGVKLPMVVRCPGKKAGTRNPNFISYTDVLPTFLDWTGHSKLESQNPAGRRRLGRSLLPIIDTQQELRQFDHVFGSHTFHETSSYYPTRYLRTKKWKYHRNIAWQLPFPFGGDLYGALSFEAMRNQQKPVKLGERLLTDYIHRPPEQLFDIENDPSEVYDVADNPEYQEVLLDCRRKLENWQRMTNDQWLFRDGVSLGCVNRHINHGLKIPDRFDFDAENPGTKEVPLVQKKDKLPHMP